MKLKIKNPFRVRTKIESHQYDWLGGPSTDYCVYYRKWWHLKWRIAQTISNRETAQGVVDNIKYYVQ